MPLKSISALLIHRVLFWVSTSMTFKESGNVLWYVRYVFCFFSFCRLSELWKVSIVWNDCAMECVMTGKEIEEGHFIWQMVPCVTFHTKLCICIFPISCKLESCKWIITLFGIKVKLTRDYNATNFSESPTTIRSGGSFFLFSVHDHY